MISGLNDLNPEIGLRIRKLAEPARLNVSNVNAYQQWHVYLLYLERAIADNAQETVLNDLRDDCIRAAQKL